MILRCVVDDEDVRYRYNFNDDNNENVSFAIANKYIKNEGYHCIVVIRGTDGVEWEGSLPEK